MQIIQHKNNVIYNSLRDSSYIESHFIAPSQMYLKGRALTDKLSVFYLLSNTNIKHIMDNNYEVVDEISDCPLILKNNTYVSQGSLITINSILYNGKLMIQYYVGKDNYYLLESPLGEFVKEFPNMKNVTMETTLRLKINGNYDSGVVLTPVVEMARLYKNDYKLLTNILHYFNSYYFLLFLNGNKSTGNIIEQVKHILSTMSPVIEDTGKIIDATTLRTWVFAFMSELYGETKISCFSKYLTLKRLIGKNVFFYGFGTKSYVEFDNDTDMTLHLLTNNQSLYVDSSIYDEIDEISKLIVIER